MSDLIDRYFDGGWVKYVVAFLIGAAVQRFAVTPRSDADDVVALSVGFAICALILGLRWLNNRNESSPDHTSA